MKAFRQRKEARPDRADRASSLVFMRRTYWVGWLVSFVAFGIPICAQPPAGSTSGELPLDGAASAHLVPESSCHSFHLYAEERSLVRQVMQAYGIDADVDESARSTAMRFDVDDADFAETANALTHATDTFMVPLGAHHALFVIDTKENRGKYERRIAETLSFPGLSVSELTDLQHIARTIFKVDQSTVLVGQEKLSVRAPGAEVETMKEAYRELLAPRSELQLEVSVYEVSKSTKMDAGTILPNSATLFNVRSEINSIIANNSSLVDEIIASGLASAGNYSEILAALLASGQVSGTVFNNPFVLFGGGLTETGVEWNTTAANMLLSSSETKSLNRMQSRVLDQEEATFRSGERYPIKTSSYTALSSTASSGSSTFTTPQIQYEDLGLTLKVTPRIEGDNDISLNLDLKLESLAGSSLNNIPALTNRRYTSIVSLRPGESAVVVSAMSQQDALDITGLPGISDVPGLSEATNRNETGNTLDLVILITPHILRITHREAAGPMLLLPSH